LPWFRRKKQQLESPAVTADSAPDVAAPAATVEVAPSTDTLEQAEPGAEKRPRRRGSRGGRGRKKPAAAVTDTAQTEPEEPTTAKASKSGGRQERGGERRSGGDRTSRSAAARRRQPPKRSPLPAAKRELLISVDVGEQRVAIVEDDRVAEVYLERPERRSIAGNIYVGVVDNVLPGMEAAFVEIGLEKNGFLYVDEIVVPELEGKRHGRKIQDLISRGEQILVQAVKDPMKTKGARLTTEISLPGRFLVYVPHGEGLGVSRRLDDSERARLKEILKALDIKQGGVIVRTAAEGALAEDIERDLVFLQRLWKTIEARAKASKAPTLVYQEAELPLRIVRDLFAGDFVSAHVDNDRAFKRIVSYLKKTSPHMIERVHRYKEKETLFAVHGVDREIESTLNRRVDLPSGGYLVFDYAEAFTVVDVNTGRFVGSRSKTSGARLEDTITKNNLEAVKEVVRQLRLRDIGGIIVIDFIDMANPKNRATVEDALRTELERDRTKTYVVEISPLGLVEMTRQNVTDGPREILTRKCPVCAGDGIVVSDETVALGVERRLRAHVAAGTRIQAYKIALHPRIRDLIAGPGGERLGELEAVTRRRFFLVEATGAHVHLDHFEVVAEGKLVDLAPESPVEEGSEIEVKLVEVGLHDPTAGAGKLDGVTVNVANAGKLVGRKVKVRVGRVLDGVIHATLVEAGNAPAPITFESEAEKPTRAPARRRVAGAEAGDTEAVEREAVPGASDEPETDVELEEEALGEEADTVGEVDADGVVRPKKRTRRGSRGGRRRRKPAAANGDGTGDGTVIEIEAPADGLVSEHAAAAVVEVDAALDGAAEPAAATRPPRRRSPRIHVPGDAPSATPVSKRTVAAPAAAAVDGVDTEGEDVAEVAPTDGAAPDGVAPKKRTRRGTRGGRNRKKPGAAAAAGADAVDGTDDTESPALAVDDAPRAPRPARAPVVAPTAPVAEAAPANGAPDYVPMSEWLDDFNR
jgi:ribonuclease G